VARYPMRKDEISVIRWLFGPGPREAPGHLWPRWLFLRALGLIFSSAFYSLAFQVRGLIGPDGILPAGDYLGRVAQNFGALGRVWYAPTLLWLGSGPAALKALWIVGLLASVLIVLNIWPRLAVAVCLVCFLSFVSAAQDFSSYQSDGMLLAAAFLCLFFAPPGLRPGLGEDHPPSRASRFLLQWLWFTIYFESGVVKIASGEPQWRHLTAMDHYYENGPLPNWPGWYVQQLPHAFHAAVALYTLVAELALVWMLFLPRRWRIACFLIVTPFQIGIILTANLAFLNHLVLALGFLLLDDQFLRWVSGVWRRKREARSSPIEAQTAGSGVAVQASDSGAANPNPGPRISDFALRWPDVARRFRLAVPALCLSWIFYDTAALLLLILFPQLPLPSTPIIALEPFRLANQYGLFAVMTRARYEIEFQGSRDGKTWTPYPFRYKPQDPRQAPRIHAPYQPRFDWNLWFASLETWRQYPWVVRTEELLLQNDPAVLSLFAGNPFPGQPPRQVSAVVWRYWFTDLATKRKEGLWWHRERRGLYAPTLEREPDGKFVVVEWPGGNAPPATP
jgi:lipase maturation factor 1